MSFFLKGDFRIEDSWDQPKDKKAQQLVKQTKNEVSLKGINPKPQTKTSSRPPSNPTLKPKRIEPSIPQQKAANPFLNAGINMVQPTLQIDNGIAQKIVKDLISEGLPSETSHCISSSSARRTPSNKSRNEGDLLGSMAARLRKMQQTCQHQREEIKESGRELERVRNENQLLKGIKEGSNQHIQRITALQEENVKLRAKTQAMQKLLQQYGLKWVGGKMEGKLEADQLRKDIKPPAFHYRLPSEVDLGTIMRRVQDLNGCLFAEGRGTEISNQDGVHRLRPAEALPIGFFSDGVAIKGFPFYPYKAKESLQIIGDILDGYFPYVLKRKYPDGVLLRVVDNVSTKYSGESSSTVINSLESRRQNEFKPQSKEEFLKNIPEQVMRNGKLISIREGIAQVLQGRREKEIHIDFEEKEGMRYLKTGVIPEEEDTATLKIRDQNGGVWLLHLKKYSLMESVYEWVGKVQKGGFKLIGGYPRRAFQRQDGSIEQCGLHPNGLLHVEKGKEE